MRQSAINAVQLLAEDHQNLEALVENLKLEVLQLREDRNSDNCRINALELSIVVYNEKNESLTKEVAQQQQQIKALELQTVELQAGNKSLRCQLDEMKLDLDHLLRNFKTMSIRDGNTMTNVFKQHDKKNQKMFGSLVTKHR